MCEGARRLTGAGVRGDRFLSAGLRPRQDGDADPGCDDGAHGREPYR